MDTLVSIILPTHNAAHTIPRSIRSVQAQTYQRWELLIIDDGSSDNTREIVRPFLDDVRIQFIQQEQNRGIQKTLNHGLQNARGTYIARIDADDVWVDRTKLETQVQFLSTHPEYVLVGTGAILINAEGAELTRYLLPSTDRSIRRRMLGKNCFTHSSVLFKKAAVSGGYDESMETKHVEDYDLWLRIGLIGKFANIPSHMVMLSATPTTITARNRLVQARRILRIAWRYRTQYPNALLGLCISTIRLAFFWVRNVIPIPQGLLYKIQGIVRGI